MPVLYQTYSLPEGPARGRRYQGKSLHDDLTIKPMAAGVLGRAYLDQIEGMLAKIKSTQMPKIAQAAQWWGQASSATTLVTGHMFLQGGHQLAVMDVEHLGFDAQDLVRALDLGGPAFGERLARLGGMPDVAASDGDEFDLVALGRPEGRHSAGLDFAVVGMCSEHNDSQHAFLGGTGG